MTRSTYRLADEPGPSSLTRFAVRPFWPFLALMLGGGWIGWPWFAFNALAVGSPTKRRESLLAAGAFGANLLLTMVLVALLSSELIGARVARYAVLGLVVLKLGAGYAIHALQSRTFPVYEHFGGPVKNGAPVLGVAFAIKLLVLVHLPLFWWLVLS